MSHALEHETWMKRALELAGMSEGLTRPNPPVGAVLVRGGKIVGEGRHRKAGGPHAEVEALRSAAARARGATLYVTLEPCSTFGRTPPCTAAIMAAGVSRVVAAMRDPNPRHCGRGFAILRRAGIDVISGCCAAQAAGLLAPFAKRVREGRPFLTLKLAMTFDGRIADASGRSRWITSPAARREVQRLRRAADAILVGSGTIIADDPMLLPRPLCGRNPFRVVADAAGRTPPSAKIFANSPPGQTIIATTNRSPAAIRAAWAATGAWVWTLPSTRRGVSLNALLARLGEKGALRVLCEGGGELAAGLVDDGLVDEFKIFLAPKLLGANSTPAFGGAGWKLASAPRIKWTSIGRVGKDILIHAVPEKPCKKGGAKTKCSQV